MAGRGAREAAAAALPALPREPLRLGSLESTKVVLAVQKAQCDGLREKCASCGAADGGGVRLRACDACDAVRYCDRECQRADWPVHLHACKVLATDREIMVRVGVSPRARNWVSGCVSSPSPLTHSIG